MGRSTMTVEDLISRIQRELPDTDRTRYDIAYERGRAQARSATFFGGLALGGVLGAGLTFLLDPERGRARRAELRQQATARWNDLSRVAEGRSKDLRNRLTGFAIEKGLREPPQHEDTGAAGTAGTEDRVVVPVVTRSGPMVVDEEERIVVRAEAERVDAAGRR